MREREIVRCTACGAEMDITTLAPFTNVACPACGEHSRVKTAFGPYRLTRRHAVGGMSMVFVAEDLTLGREAVVKILSEEYSRDEKRIAAFEEEARITASISHPHVVRVFTTGRASGRFFIGMEFVPGGHYEHHIRERGSIPEEEVLPIAIQVAEGLKAAQAAGLIHRDVKPGNILLDAEGNAKLVDFGLALVTKGGTAQADELWATPYYVPPETIEGLPEDFRSDIYAFGASFYHALAGVPPCAEESMNTERLREAKRAIKPLAQAAKGLHPATCRTIDRAMAHDPDRRPASYDELIADLKAALAALDGGADAPDGRERRSAARRREKLSLAAAMLLVVAALGFAVWWTGRGGGEVEAPVEADAGEVEAEPEVLEIDPRDQAAVRLSRRYRAAVDALAQREFLSAREAFAAVRDDPHVMEPTGSWAACEAVMAALMEGRGDEARSEADKARRHIEAASTLDPAIAATLGRSLEAIDELAPMSGAGEGDPPAVAGLVSMMAALKNWEQGLMDRAAPLFERVIREAEGGSGQLGGYAGIARDYLADWERLQQAEPADYELPADEARALVDELHALHSGLRTRGRAPFAVRQWQLGLARAARSDTPGEGGGAPPEGP